MKEITNHDYKFWADAADNLIKGLPKLLSEIKTLEQKGYSYKGGELWKPPIGKTPDFNLIDSLNERIKELESEKHVNEIKANAIIEAINCDMEYVDNCPIPRNYEYGMVLLRLNAFAEKLRTNHDNVPAQFIHDTINLAIQKIPPHHAKVIAKQEVKILLQEIEISRLKQLIANMMQSIEDIEEFNNDK